MLLTLAVSDGPTQVVTGTLRHRAARTIDLTIAGESSPIGCTGNHPFWSEDRQDFVRADSLQPGETLRTPTGLTTVVSTAPLPGETHVYNLEVHGLQVYHVGQSGLLVHNGGLNILGGPCFVPKQALQGWTTLSESGAADNLLYHFMKHGDDVGAAYVAQYAKMATEMWNFGKGWKKYDQVIGNIDHVWHFHKGDYYMDVDWLGNIVSFGLR